MYGDRDARTPHFDRLAAEGVRFRNSCSTYPICVPFRFTFMAKRRAVLGVIPSAVHEFIDTLIGNADSCRPRYTEAQRPGAAFEEVVGDAALQGVGAAEGAGDVGVVQEQGSGADVEGVAQFEEHAHGRVEEAALDFGDDALVGADPAGQLGLVRSYRLR